MTDYLGKTVIFVVAQRPFESQRDNDVRNLFATLAPLCTKAGDSTEDEDFPNCGLAWWMVTGSGQRIAKPGTLVRAVVEQAVIYKEEDPTSSYYQVRRDQVVEADMSDLVEVLSVRDDLIAEPRALIRGTPLLRMNRPPANQAIVLWKSHAYGPLRTVTNADGAEYAVGFDLMQGRVPREIDRSALPTDESSGRLKVEVRISFTAKRRDRSEGINCVYDVLCGPALRSVFLTGRPIDLDRDVDVLRRLSRRLSSSKQHREFGALLAQLGDRTVGNDTVNPTEREVLEMVRSTNSRDVAALDELAKALLASGTIAPWVDQALEEAKRAYVEKHATALQSQVRTEVETLSVERQRLEREVEDLRNRQSQAQQELEQGLASTRAEFEKEEKARRQQLDDDLARTRAEHTDMSRKFEDLQRRFVTERDNVVTELLAHVTTLEAAGLLPRFRDAAVQSPVLERDRGAPVTIGLPEFTKSGHVGAAAVRENEFLDRFIRGTERQGYSFRQMDLVSFHLSVKCGDITILGGRPGTGKSSLPRLYAAALLGEAGQTEWERFREIAVSPSWLELRDLVGYVNAVDRSFQPSESGLYETMVWAHEEEATKADLSGMYLVCLDEMNLSHVEHYFGAFLQVLERPERDRFVDCFSAPSVASDSPFARWARLRLPKSVRFVGTVNFDETTKPLSLRLLDRANLIEIRPGNLSYVGAEGLAAASRWIDGPPVTLQTYRSWVKPPAVPAELAKLLDDLRPHLETAGAPITPRRYRALVQFVASASGDFCSPEQALDLQIAQRLLPQVRGVYRSDVKDSLERIASLLANGPGGLPESCGKVAGLLTEDSDLNP